MAIDPYAPVAAGKRYIDNQTATLLRLEDPKRCLIQSTTRILRDCPPNLPWAYPFRGETYRGFFTGPTSVAYLFWTISTKHPDLEIEGKRPAEWCRLYLELGQDSVPPLLESGCGISNEYLASNALKACLYQSQNYADKVLEAARTLPTDPTYCEWLKGRAGTLYILRMMRTWLTPLKAVINLAITCLIEAILSQQPWSWNNHQYLGLVHGDIGIVTQIVLSDPSHAPRLEGKLRSLLSLQGGNGNWPVIEGRDLGLIQFCHGAPGFLLSLLALKEHFPSLHREIDDSVAKGRELIWEHGLLNKEPNICHGITGNAIVLESAQREHFLSFATPEKIEIGIADGTYEKVSEPIGLLWGEAGRAWVWMDVWDGTQGQIILYNDV